LKKKISPKIVKVNITPPNPGWKAAGQTKTKHLGNHTEKKHTALNTPTNTWKWPWLLRESF